MQIKLISKPVGIKELSEAAQQQYGDFIKAVVNVNKKIMALGGELHADAEALLLEQGSRQQDLWGINLYPSAFGSPDFVEFDSMINIRPSTGNRTRGVQDAAVRGQILSLVKELVRA